MRSTVRKLGWIMAMLTLAAACSDKSSNNDDDDDDPQNQSVMAGTIDGGTWTGTGLLSTRSGTTVTLSGHDTQNREIKITITGVSASGNFLIGNGAAAAVTLQVGSQLWVGHLTGASGSVTIGTLTSTYMTGSYSVILAPQAATGATGNKTMAGTFTAYFTAQT